MPANVPDTARHGRRFDACLNQVGRYRGRRWLSLDDADDHRHGVVEGYRNCGDGHDKPRPAHLHKFPPIERMILLAIRFSLTAPRVRAHRAIRVFAILSCINPANN